MSHSIPKIGFISLGCPKATVDSERILTQLRAEGYLMTPDYQDAHLVIINTCGFINEAVEESLEVIEEALAENGQVIVTGCLGARADFLQNTFPQLLAITGANALEPVMTAIHSHLPPPHDPRLSLIPPGGIKLTPRHYAYLKIAEGCQQKCSFCIIPSLRGSLVSRPIGEVLTEAERLVEAGVQELLIISQDTAAYGLDTQYRLDFWQGRPIKTKILSLAQQLSRFGIWIRLHYVYPYPHIDQLIPLMVDNLILPYLDVPLQHANRDILKAMRRPADSENLLRRIESWRAQCPQLTLRSTFIVGFPGETEQQFEELLTFLQIARLDRVGAFAYSPIEGAAANDFPNPIPSEIQEARLARFMEVQSAISAEKLQQRIGQTTTVLVDEITSEVIYARSVAEAPEIDGMIIIERDNEALEIAPGDFLTVTIINADEHDLFAQIKEHNEFRN